MTHVWLNAQIRFDNSRCSFGHRLKHQFFTGIFMCPLRIQNDLRTLIELVCKAKKGTTHFTWAKVTDTKWPSERRQTTSAVLEQRSPFLSIHGEWSHFHINVPEKSDVGARNLGKTISYAMRWMVKKPIECIQSFDTTTHVHPPTRCVTDYGWTKKAKTRPFMHPIDAYVTWIVSEKS